MCLSAGFFERKLLKIKTSLAGASRAEISGHFRGFAANENSSCASGGASAVLERKTARITDIRGVHAKSGHGSLFGPYLGPYLGIVFMRLGGGLVAIDPPSPYSLV